MLKLMDEGLLNMLAALGLQQKEARTYLALLRLGEATVQDIAKAAHVRRSTAYALLDGLKRQGFVFETKVQKHTKYVAENPAIFVERFQEKAATLGRNAKMLSDAYTQKLQKPRTFFFNGAEGFRKIWQVIFKSGIKEFLIITDPEQFHGYAKAYYIRSHVISEKLRLGIHSRHLVNATEFSKEITSRDTKENRETRILPHTYKISYTIIIFGGSVALISPVIENMILIIESEAFAKTQRALFEALWGAFPSARH